MRIMLDTNVIISHILFNNDKMEKFFNFALNKDELIISNVIIDELKELFSKKFRNKISILNIFLKTLHAECINVYGIDDMSLFEIRDKSDYPVLYSAIKGNVDIFVTGDEDFKNVKIDKPKIMSINEYMDQYYKF